ncbi:MAG: enoyl-CoA hydratase/isomerase family protein [Pseudomonadota bacterium]
MHSNVLDYSVDGPVCTIMLNRPDSLNSFNRELRADLLKALQAAETDSAIRVVILKGSGKGFCAGADLGEGLDRDIGNELREEYKPFLMAIHNSSKVIIAQAHGCVAGIGAGLAMACDIVVMSENAYLYMAFAAIGLIPDGGINWHLYKALGPRKAFETIVEGKRLSAQECLEHGICNQVVPRDQLEKQVRERAEKIAAGAPLAQAALKAMFRGVGDLDLSQAISRESEIQQPLTESEDCRNAIDAFFRKEKPVFEGK